MSAHRISAEAPHRLRTDVALAGLLFAGTVCYLALLPNNLNPADEANYLYDAKRVLHGAVTYRDYFTVITPGFMYLTAGLFWLFGTTIRTARIAAAVLHGLMATLVYLTCRRMGVRQALSWPPALAQIVIVHPAWPIASQHWLSTFLCVALLYVCAGRIRQRVTWPLIPGILLGLLIGVQQQRGLFMAAGIFLWLIVDAALQQRYPARQQAPLVAQLGVLTVGTVAVVMPLLIHMIAGAGLDPVWQDLVLFPLFNYRSVTHCEWGNINAMTAWQGSFTFPRVLKYLPVILVVSVSRLLVLWLRHRRPEEVATLTLVSVFCLASILSIAYFPDFIHIAFIAPAFFVTIAENLEWGARHIPVSSRLVRATGWAAATALLTVSAMRLHHNCVRLHAEFPFSRITAFGQIQFRTAAEVAIYDRLRQLLRETPSRYVYVYPGAAHLYLLLNVENPTPYGFYVASFHGAERLQITLDQLTKKRPPYIVMVTSLLAPDDRLADWVRNHYEPLADDGPAGQFIFRRKRGEREESGTDERKQ